MSYLNLLKSRIPLNSLSEQNLRSLAEKAQVQELPKGSVIFEHGDSDQRSIYLLAGEIELAAKDGSARTVVASNDEARYALAQLRPRQYSGTSKTAVTIAWIDGELLDHLLTVDQLCDAGPQLDGYEVTEMEGEGGPEWMMQMLQSKAFEKLPPGNMTNLLAIMQEVYAKPGERIIKQGDPGEHYYVIKEGCVAVTRDTIDGDSAVLAELSEGDVFGEEALLSNAPRNANITAKGEVTLMRLAKSDFDALLTRPLVQTVTLEEANKMIKNGARLLDVRTQDEYRVGALRGSANTPLLSLREELTGLDPNGQFIVCCQNGTRSRVAAFLMNQRGFDVYVLQGGLQGLSKWPGNAAA